ncbi:Cas10/Cmr2 second palm domain-containing protein [Pyrobaculum sp.]|uniref:Cas10/Cmr2 second palm domain-containing protein n=1 Tax=Pyrobaculum sp. TaxID=2004705 RepID=UPI003D0BD02E
MGSSVVKFRGAHRYLDSSPRLVDLRGRNMLVNAARWLVAAASHRAEAVHVDVAAEGAPRDLLRELAYFLHPAAVGDANQLTCGLGSEACVLCGRPAEARTYAAILGEEVYSHVAREGALDLPCLAARLFGRSANKPAFLFAIYRRAAGDFPHWFNKAKWLKHYGISVGFLRHGEEVKCMDDAAVLRYCDVAVAVVGVESNCVKGHFDSYAKAVREATRRDHTYAELAGLREEFLRKLAEEVGAPLRAVYQPEGGGVPEGFVPQLSGVNAGGELDEVDTERLAGAAGTNTVFVVRFDGDRFGSRAREAGLPEEELAKFKSAVSAHIEVGPRGAYRSAVVYAGGDENMFVAATKSVEDVLAVLRNVRRLFTSTLGTTISAGVVAARYKMPMYHIARLANEAAEAAKAAGRDAVALLYAKSLLSREFGVAKFSDLDEFLRAARRYLDERPPLPEEPQCRDAALSHLLPGLPKSEAAAAFMINTALLMEL